MRKLQTWFWNLLIRYKILAVWSTLLVGTLGTIVVVANLVFSNAFIGESTKKVQENSRLVADKAASVMADAASCANMITLNLNSVLETKGAGRDDFYDIDTFNEINNQLKFALLVFTDVQSAYFADRNGHVYASLYLGGRGGQDMDGFRKSGMFELLSSDNGRNRWFAASRRDFMAPDPDEPVFTLGKRILHIKSGKELGILILNISEPAFSQNLSRSGLGDGYFLLSPDGTVLSSSWRDRVLLPLPAAYALPRTEAPEVRRPGGEQPDVLLVRSPVQGSDWTLLSVTSLSKLSEGSTRITLLIVGIALAALLVSMAVAVRVSRAITEPLDHLAKAMSRLAGGELLVSAEIAHHDEVGVLARGFNDMVARIRALLEDVRQEQKKKAEYRLALMQTQIKPHFLYNTLETVYALAMMRRFEETGRTVKALADFYRDALAGGAEYVTFEREFQTLRNYLLIQQTRYSDRFDYTIELDPETSDRLIPRLSVQPLVENAIYHGLKQQEAYGHLWVRSFVEGDSAVIAVEDDGPGIPERERTRLLRTRGASFGLFSVNQRLRLMYGEGSGLELGSRDGGGARVLLRVPLVGLPLDMAREEGGVTEGET